eukprot:ANDGO_04054.mRNA.1 hypothetical protein
MSDTSIRIWESRLHRYVADPSIGAADLHADVLELMRDVQPRDLENMSLDLLSLCFMIMPLNSEYVSPCLLVVRHLCSSCSPRDLGLEILYRLTTEKFSETVCVCIIECAWTILGRMESVDSVLEDFLVAFLDLCSAESPSALHSADQPHHHENLHGDENHDGDATLAPAPVELETFPEHVRFGCRYVHPVLQHFSEAFLSRHPCQSDRLVRFVLVAVCSLHDHVVPPASTMQLAASLVETLSGNIPFSDLVRNRRYFSELQEDHEAAAGMAVLLFSAFCEGDVSVPRVVKPGFWFASTVPFLLGALQLQGVATFGTGPGVHSLAAVHVLDVMHFTLFGAPRYCTSLLTEFEVQVFLDLFRMVSTFMVQCPVQSQRTNSWNLLQRAFFAISEYSLRWKIVRDVVSNSPFSAVQCLFLRLLKDNLLSVSNKRSIALSEIQEIEDLMVYRLAESCKLAVDNSEVLNGVLNVFMFMVGQKMLNESSVHRMRPCISLAHQAVTNAVQNLQFDNPRLAMELEILTIAFDRIAEMLDAGRSASNPSQHAHNCSRC